MRPLYRSPNGDTWFLARDAETGAATCRPPAAFTHARVAGDLRTAPDSGPILGAVSAQVGKKSPLIRCWQGIWDSETGSQQTASTAIQSAAQRIAL